MAVRAVPEVSSKLAFDLFLLMVFSSSMSVGMRYGNVSSARGFSLIIRRIKSILRDGELMRLVKTIHSGIGSSVSMRASLTSSSRMM